MSLLRLSPGFLAFALLAAIANPAGADQVFSTVSTGPVYIHATPAPYPLGDLYYAPCGWNGSGSGSNHGGGRGGRNGSTTLTGERFYPYDIRSDGNRVRSNHGNRGNGYGNCWGQSSRNGTPHPSPRRPYPSPTG